MTSMRCKRTTDMVLGRRMHSAAGGDSDVKWYGLDYWDNGSVAGVGAWRDILDDVMDSVMEDAPYENKEDFDDAVMTALRSVLIDVLHLNRKLVEYYAEFVEKAFAEDVEDALMVNAENGGDGMSVYYGRDHESSRKAHRMHASDMRMKHRSFLLDNGQVIEQMSMRDGMRQARDMVDADRYAEDVFGEGAYGIGSDESLWVEYADGTHFSLGYGEEPGRFRMTGATCVIIENGYTTQVAGKYRIEDSVGGDGDVYHTVVPE